MQLCSRLRLPHPNAARGPRDRKVLESLLLMIVFEFTEIMRHVTIFVNVFIVERLRPD